MGLYRHIGILRSAWALILGAVIAAIVISAVVSSVLPRTYEARATLYVGQPLNQPQLDYSGLLASQIVTNTYARLATTLPLIDAVIDTLHLSTTRLALQQNITTEVPVEGSLLVIIARDRDAQTAATIANAVANQLLAIAPKDDPAATADRQRRLTELDATINRLQTEADALQALNNRTQVQNDRLDTLEERLVTFNQARATLTAEIDRGSPNALSLVDPAVPAQSPVAPSRTVIVGVSAIGALALAVLIAYLLDAARRGRAETTAVRDRTW